VTQFTYFQQCGGFDLKPIMVELTYGLERLAMLLQDVHNVFELHWNEQVTYQQLFHQGEVEFSEYNFHQADNEMLLRLFDMYEKEGARLAKTAERSKRSQVLPAYDYTLKSSHVFNILDARGAISVTERQAYIGRVRALARQCAVSYLAERERLGWPLIAH
jgi:glycyl-tRNA synthetase alpha chain